MHKLLMMINKTQGQSECCDLCTKMGTDECSAGCDTARAHIRDGGRLKLKCIQGDNGRGCYCSRCEMKTIGQIAREMGVSVNALKQ